MRVSCFVVLLVLTMSLHLVYAQAVMVRSGYYHDLETVWAAPGQVLTFYLHGIGTRVTEPAVSRASLLPTSVAGIRVELSGVRPIPVPILAILPLTGCNHPIIRECGPILAMLLQIPYELPLSPPGPPVAPTLTFFEDEVEKLKIVLASVPQAPHILTTHDSLSILTPEVQVGVLRPLVRHADGTFVSEANPARPGEKLTLRAVGLGYIGERPPTGAPALQDMETRLGISFEFGQNPVAKMIDLLPDGNLPVEG